jgi:hypothetical protein
MLPLPVDPATLIRDVNATHKAVEHQSPRACEAARHSARAAEPSIANC